MKSAWSDAALVLAALLTLLFLVYPVVVVFTGSVQSSATLFSGTAFSFTFDNYGRIFESGFARFLSNSLFICLTAVVCATALSVAAAYAFSRRPRFPLRRLLLGAVLAGQLFPWIVLVTPLFILFARLGLTNSYGGIIFCYTAIAIPFSLYMLLGYLESIPRELDEAAAIDGCSALGVLWRVVLPLMIPGVVATATYAFLLCWTEFLFALAFLTRAGLKTLPLGLAGFFGEDTVDWGAVMAGSAITTLPALLLFLPLQSRLAEGLTAGAVKQ
ncbi:MAG TPA: carbohydrate ABC transporter permease [Acetobacteraceae bacterium]|jgi:ABC-type glycerol-3-phosphate transport system permease component|nr:carbohydrate ABC transporter permease [Acetobacteraceae bacterium]